MVASNIESSLNSNEGFFTAFVKIDHQDPYRLSCHLSSDRCIGLTDERTMDRLMSSDEAHRSLRAKLSFYELIEWIEFYPADQPDRHFRYMGYDLAQTHLLLSELSEFECDELIHLLTLPPIQRFQARARRDYDQHKNEVVEFLANPLKWTYPLKDWLEKDLNHQRQKLSPEQWITRLDKITGIKKDELRGSGLTRFLQQSDAHIRLSTETLIAALNYTAIKPVLYRHVTTQGHMNPFDFKWVNKPASKKHLKLMPDFVGEVDVYLQHRVYGYEILRVTPDDLLKGPTHWLVVTDQKLIASTLEESFFDSFAKAVAAANAHMSKAITSRALLQSHTEYREYTACEELHHYSNWVLTLPNFPAHLHGYSHFELRNVWLHLRTSIEVCAKTGERCLVIHELQSDLLQHRLDEYHLDVYNPKNESFETLPWASHWFETAINIALSLAVQNSCGGIALMSGYHQNITFDQHHDDPRLINFYDRICMKVINRIASDWGSVVHLGEFSHTESSFHLVHFKKGYLWLNQHGQPIQEFNTLEEAIPVMNRECILDVVEIPVMPLTEPMKHQIQHSGVPLMGPLRKPQ